MMKINGIKRLFFLAFVVVSWTGCTKSSDDELTYMGRWIEESPVGGRTELAFLTPSVLVISKAENSVDEFKYQVVGDSIHLILADNYPDGAETSLFFKQSDGNSLQIGNLYPSIPEQEPSFIIFERKP